MNEIVFKAVELLVMAAVVVIVGQVIPMIKQHIKQDRMDSFRLWVEDAVAYAQQLFDRNSDKKDVVKRILRDIRDEEKLPLTNDQIDILIESAVKQLKIMEGNVEMIIEQTHEIGEASDGTT